MARKNDEITSEEDAHVESGDPLGFRVDGKKYRDRVKAAFAATRAATEPAEPPTA